MTAQVLGHPATGAEGARHAPAPRAAPVVINAHSPSVTSRVNGSDGGATDDAPDLFEAPL
jgi:hypothetical protein